MSNNSFGGKERYYSAAPTDDSYRKNHLSKTEEAIKAALLTIDPDIQHRIERTFRQWNTIIREQLRNEMGLRLTVSGEYQSVPVRIATGLARPLHDTFRNMEPLYWQLLFNRGMLEASKPGLSFLYNNCHAITVQAVQEPCLHIQKSLQYIEAILADLDKEKLLQQALAIEHDLLGAYFYNNSQIELYWMAIGLVAGSLGIKPEALTLVVAIHELAHAYSHLGKDIDGTQWDKSNFENADLLIVEGIAQHYTKVICHTMDTRLPGTKKAFETLLCYQSTPYTIFKKWNLPPESGGEVVRLAMIACRSQGITEYPSFQETMKNYENIKQNPSRQAKPA